jgi:hypothetical protein
MPGSIFQSFFDKIGDFQTQFMQKVRQAVYTPGSTVWP